MGIKLVFLFLSFFATGKLVISLSLTSAYDKLSEDGKLNFTGIAAKYGYAYEQYEITTEDGYILTMFRIPGDADKPVLLVHGNTVTSDCYIIRGNESLALTLARKGYDVWTINLRGTRYSRSHVTLDPDTQPDQFFNYSFYELAIYDMPVTIDFILQETGQSELIAFGHSMGTTLFYVLGSEKPEYNDKIKLCISLAPICFLEHITGLASTPAKFAAELNLLGIATDTQELLSYSVTTPILQALCLQPTGYAVCIQGVLFYLFGYDSAGLEEEFMYTLFGHFPGGTTRKIFDHLGQVYNRNVFAKYDYGTAGNLIAYNSTEPPEFDLSKVKMKSVLIVGQEDFLARDADVQRLNASLPNVAEYLVLPYENFNHVDFIWGNNMTNNFYPYVFEVLENYT
ncbi:lipase 1-like [Ostrinia furnacalis]|uniref:lipase 1-like n=1 Tax=Ostrinia furnacalis TaxID=93504 RepID=UPI00103A9CEA|nr:lipase 1-like [Ostrinia furnacalis]